MGQSPLWPGHFCERPHHSPARPRDRSTPCDPVPHHRWCSPNFWGAPRPCGFRLTYEGTHCPNQQSLPTPGHLSPRQPGTHHSWAHLTPPRHLAPQGSHRHCDDPRTQSPVCMCGAGSCPACACCPACCPSPAAPKRGPFWVLFNPLTSGLRGAWPTVTAQPGLGDLQHPPPQDHALGSRPHRDLTVPSSADPLPAPSPLQALLTQPLPAIINEPVSQDE